MRKAYSTKGFRNQALTSEIVHYLNNKMIVCEKYFKSAINYGDQKWTASIAILSS